MLEEKINYYVKALCVLIFRLRFVFLEAFIIAYASLPKSYTLRFADYTLTERSYIYTSLGFGYLYHTYWDEYLNRNATALGSAPPLLLNLGYSLRF